MKIKLFFLFFLLSTAVFGQVTPKVEYALKRQQYEIIDSLCQLIRKYHCDTAQARIVVASLRQKLEQKRYAPYTSNKIEFIEAVSADLQDFSQNPAFRMTYTPFLDLYKSHPEVSTFHLDIPQAHGEKYTLMLEYPSTFLPQADYMIFPKGNVPKYLYSPPFQQKMHAKLYHYWLQNLGVELHKLDLHISPTAHEKYLMRYRQKAIELDKKWLKNGKLTDWQGLYLMPTEQWEHELVDPVLQQPYEYGTKKGKKTLFSKMVELKQRIRHFGFTELRTLEGNMSYLKIAAWADAEYTDPKILNQVMGYLAEHEAVILDLRGNRQGKPSLLPLFCSYFLAPKKMAVLAQYQGKNWETLPKIKGKPARLHEKKIYLLTDSLTAGTSEILIAFLKKYNEAKIVGMLPKPTFSLTHRFPLQAGRVYVDIPYERFSMPEKAIQTPDKQVVSEWALAEAKMDFLISKKKNTRYAASQFYYQYLTDCEMGQKIQIKNLQDSLEKYKGDYILGKKLVAENGKMYLLETQGKREMVCLGTTWVVREAYGSELNGLDYTHPIAGTQARIAYISFVWNKKNKRFDLLATYSSREEALIWRK